MRRVPLALVLALGAALLLSDDLDAKGKPGPYGHSSFRPGGDGSTTNVDRMPVLPNPFVLPAWPTRPGPTGMRLPGSMRPGASRRTVSGSTNLHHLTGAVVAVRPGAWGSVRGTIQLRLARVELPVINGKQRAQPDQDVTVYVSDATSFHVRGRKGQASLGDVHLGETVRIGLGEGRTTRDVEILALVGSGR